MENAKMNSLIAQYPLVEDLVALKETTWFNPGTTSLAEGLPYVGLTEQEHINAHGRCLHHSLFYPYYFPFENQLITSRSFGISCGCFLLPMLHIVSAKQERMPSYTTGAALVNAESGRNGQPKTA